MSDLEQINLNVGDETYELTKRNSKLFTFWGHVALENGDTEDISVYNHVYFISGEEPDRQAHYVLDPETVHELGAVMLRNHFPASLFAPSVPEEDRNARALYLQQNQNPEIGDFVPEGWV